MSKHRLPAEVAVEIASDPRFTSKIDKTQDCWIWTGAKVSTGYGGINRKKYGYLLAHRVTYAAANKIDIPVGNFEIDHLCRVRECVNPDHLELVTSRENQARGKMAPCDTTCRSGKHAWTPDNIYTCPNGTRACRQCRKERRRDHYKKTGK